MLFSAKTSVIECMEKLDYISYNGFLKGGDATDWVKKFGAIRNKLDECENILDDLNEKYQETCFSYGELMEGKDA